MDGTTMKIEPTATPVADEVAAPGVVKAVNNVRQGETSGHMRWVLGVSTALAIVTMGVFFAFYA
jgi:hypothetical protein